MNLTQRRRGAEKKQIGVEALAGTTGDVPVKAVTPKKTGNLRNLRFLFFKVLPWLAALGLLALALRAVPLRETLAALRELAVVELLWLMVANIGVLLLLNGRWWLILRGQGYRIPFLTLTGHRLAAFGLSYFTPGPHFGGEPLQVALVVKHHGVPRHAAIAAVSLDKTLELLVNFGFLAAGVGVVMQAGLFGAALGSRPALFAGLLLALPLAVLILLALGKRPLSGALRPLRLVIHIFPQWQPTYQQVIHNLQASEAQATHFCRRSPLALLLALLVSVLGWLAMIAEFWLMLTFLGLPLPLLQVVMVLTAARIAYLLPMPGGLGTLEASQVIAFAALGYPTAVAISAALLIRGRDVSLGALGLLWGVLGIGNRRLGTREP